MNTVFKSTIFHLLSWFLILGPATDSMPQARLTGLAHGRALSQKSSSVVTSFVGSSCDFVNRSFCPEKQGDPRSHTNQHEPKYLGLALDVPFEAKHDGSDQLQEQAKRLWELAIAAKGGRETLSQVDSMAMSYEETARNFLGIAVHKGPVEQVYQFPDKSWEWDDGLPPPFRRTIRLLNIERNLRCYLHEGAATPNCGPASQGNSLPDEGITQVQYLYLMETRWVKPTPTGVTKSNLGFKTVDVLHTRFQNKRIDYFLDRKTHLPLRVAVFYGTSDRPTLTIDISSYSNIAGIQMPAKQKRGKISFQINPSYDGGIFTRQPSFSAGSKAWMG